MNCYEFIQQLFSPKKFDLCNDSDWFFAYNFRSKARQESELLKSYLKKAQDDIVALLDEKRKLLDTVRNLQVSLAINFND